MNRKVVVKRKLKVVTEEKRSIELKPLHAKPCISGTQ